METLQQHMPAFVLIISITMQCVPRKDLMHSWGNC